MARKSAAHTMMLYGTLWGLAIEAVTLAGRYLGGVQVTRDTSWLAPLTLGYRIHHGYFGLLILLFGSLLPGRWRRWGWTLGWALLLSDLLHHFVVLWWLEGDPQFHIRYA